MEHAFVIFFELAFEVDSAAKKGHTNNFINNLTVTTTLVYHDVRCEALLL